MAERLALAAPPSLAEMFEAITGQPVTSAEMDEMWAALLAAGCLGKDEADADRAECQTVTPSP